ncbi:peptidase domain-containing ABC transporter [Lacihabitans lacunae]|uniref:Peptidase domain-containing ABC transporter n=1 Tax=Lacihabitans lacunae TaxID=1028214 RepID=A0ABV7Z0E7_9BACT
MADNHNTSNIGQAIKTILRLLSLEKKDITDIYIYSIFAGLVSLSLPLGIQAIIGFVLAGSISNSIVVLVGLVLFGTFLSGLLQVRQLQLIEKIEQKYFVRYALEYGSRIPKLDLGVLDKYYLPELINRFFDISGLQKSLQKILVDIPAAIIQIVLGTILLSFYHPLFIAFGLVLLSVVVIIIRFTSSKGFATSMETSDYKYKVAAWFEEMARSIKTFKYAQKTSIHIEKTDELVTSYLHARTSHFKVLKFQYWSLIAFKLMVTAAMLILGVVLLIDQEINIGQFIASDIVIIAIIGSVEKLVGSMDKVYEALTAVEKLNKVAEAKIEEIGNMLLAQKEKGVSIKMEHVSFSYASGYQVLKDINLEAEPGELVGIIGDSGTGKTTILRILTGAFQNFQGKVLIDGIPLKNYDLDSIRNQTGILLGKQDIFMGSLLENITLGNDDIETEDILKVSKILGLSDYFESLPLGFETPLHQGGQKLSSKIRKNILLLRALLGKKRLLLLEDPFNFLTKEQIDGVKNYIKSKGVTVIHTAYNTERLVDCNKVMQLTHNGVFV